MAPTLYSTPWRWLMSQQSAGSGYFSPVCVSRRQLVNIDDLCFWPMRSDVAVAGKNRKGETRVQTCISEVWWRQPVVLVVHSAGECCPWPAVGVGRLFVALLPAINAQEGQSVLAWHREENKKSLKTLPISHWGWRVWSFPFDVEGCKKVWACEYYAHFCAASSLPRPRLSRDLNRSVCARVCVCEWTIAAHFTTMTKMGEH